MNEKMQRLSSLKDKAARKNQTSDYEFAFILGEAAQILKEIAPIKRKAWIEAQLMELFHLQNGKCPLCDHELIWGQFQVDHKVPHSRGGGNEFANLQLTHAFCNNSKNNGVPLSELLRYLEGRVLNL
ncbi:HNH endonuclease [Vibrio mexicanus]|uniref:HNH endonuclease n=1 Tax=Vibrio mexicanus TaxID=1004326 RepID=UPI00063C2AE8|nr:HNH endonuclease signature motif containing protein [Vibrio mexicanus]